MLLARDFSAHCTWSPLCQLMGHTLKKKSLKHYILDPAPLVSGREIISLSCLRDCFYIVGSFLDHNSISWVLLAPKKTLCKLKETVFSNYFIDSIFSYHGYTLKLILFFFEFIGLSIYLFGPRCCVQAFSSCGGARASHCGGLSRCGAQTLGVWASVVVAHGLSCSTARGILPDQGSNPCPLHWQADSQPLAPPRKSLKLILYC